MRGANGEEAVLERPAPPADALRGRGGESALLRAARSGSREAAETLARRYWDDAYRAAYLILHDGKSAEDVTQEALVAALARIGRFDTRRRFGPWLHRIVVNRSLDRLRETHRRREVSLDDTRSVPAPEPSALAPELLAALLALDPEDRAIVVLRHLFDYRAREIGQMVGLSPSSVRTRLQRALARLRATLREEWT